MATPEQCREVGKLGGRPKGSTTRPKIADYFTKEQIDNLVAKSYEAATDNNDYGMQRFLLEQIYGKARQSIEHTGEDGEAIKVKHEFSSEYAKKFNQLLKEDGV